MRQCESRGDLREAYVSIDAFRVSVPQRTLDDLQERLRRTRWTDEIDDGWTLGTNYGELRALVDYWTGAFDWRRQEEAISRSRNFARRSMASAFISSTSAALARIRFRSS